MENSFKNAQISSIKQSTYKLSIDEKRLILSAIFSFNAQKKQCKTVTIKEPDFYKTHKNAKNILLTRGIKVSHDNGEVEDLRWLHRAKHCDKKQILELDFSAEMVAIFDILQLHFDEFQLVKIKEFKSNFSIKLYEKLMLENEKGYFSKDIEELKSVFGVSGNYEKWSDFQKRVIAPAVNEINNSTNYKLKYDTARKGRFIHKVNFTFKKRK